MISISKPYFLLDPARPACCSFRAVTRDAVARLPEGVGTRSDVAILLKDSRYIVESEASMEALIKALSGTLDCLSAEDDPPARYSHSHKLWVYLHGQRLDINDPVWNI